jgi:uncharacterized protein
MRKITALLIALCISTNVSAAEFAAGAKAYDGGRYAEAFAEWSALAHQGDIRAQLAIANMHRFGEGRGIDPRKAAAWYRRAAEAGDAIAQLNYAEILEQGAGVARDIAAAKQWYRRAAAQGNAWAAEQVERLERR